MSDLIFLSSVRNKHISGTEKRFIKMGGRMVWAGLALLIISGLGITLLNPEAYLESPKFLAKMLIVFVILANGLVFHTVHIPLLSLYNQSDNFSSEIFLKKRRWILLSGSVSVVSWTVTIILGLLKDLPYNLSTILSVYILLVIISFLISLLLESKILPHRRDQ